MISALPLVAALLSLAQTNPPSAIVGIPPGAGWSVEQWSLLIGAIGLQISILITAFFTGLKALQAERLVKHSVKQNDELAAVTTKIEAHVNGEKSLAQGREAALRKENDLLREMLLDAKHAANMLTQAAATNLAIPPRGQRATDPKPEPTTEPTTEP